MMPQPTAAPLSRRRLGLLALRVAPLLLFVLILAGFASQSGRFLTVANFGNIIVQTAAIAIVAMGMTFVLLIAEIDLSVGAAMFVGAVTLGLAFAGLPWPIGLLGMMAVGAAFGLINGLLTAKLGISSFIVTLGTLFAGRGLGMWTSNTQSVYFGDSVKVMNRATLFGLPFAVIVVAAVFVLCWVVLKQLPFGRMIYAIGHDREAAKKAGIPVERVVIGCFVMSGVLAGIGGFVSSTQIGAVTSSYGLQVEFGAVAAAVLGGTSLFGGRGGVGGTLFGALLIQTTANGLVIINADPYVFPLITASIIFVAVAVDGLSSHMLQGMERRFIRPWERV